MKAKAPATGFIVVYRCGCAEIRPSREGFHERCPHHGLEPIRSPEYVVDKRKDKSSTFHGWYPEDDLTVIQPPPGDVNACTCRGSGENPDGTEHQLCRGTGQVA